ncbi:hypothetical protein CCACVL1_25453, partial [Corchorus capsularis]
VNFDEARVGGEVARDKDQEERYRAVRVSRFSKHNWECKL